jgi:hypothetical protein
MSAPHVVQMLKPVTTPENDLSGLSSGCRHPLFPLLRQASRSIKPIVSFMKLPLVFADLR